MCLFFPMIELWLLINDLQHKTCLHDSRYYSTNNSNNKINIKKKMPMKIRFIYSENFYILFFKSSRHNIHRRRMWENNLLFTVEICMQNINFNKL